MFGYVSASIKELSPEEKLRYNAVYCGLCRKIRAVAGQTARLSLSYDMTFLALLLMSLYEPEETGGPSACKLHPLDKRPWVDSSLLAGRSSADRQVDGRSATAPPLPYPGKMAQAMPGHCPVHPGLIPAGAGTLQ